VRVTNNAIKIEQHNLGVIKEPSDTLFAFKSLAIGFEIQGIQPDAHFLFTSLAKLTLLMIKGPSETKLNDQIMQAVSIFEAASLLKSELFVELKFIRPMEWGGYVTERSENPRFTLGNQIGTARERLDAIDMTGVSSVPSRSRLFSI
jgi:hypothetical protein